MKHELTARRLQQAMRDINISAQELSNKSGVAKASISQYVNGSHKPSNISSGKLATILNVNPLWLMGFEVPMLEEPAAPSTLPPIIDFYNQLNEAGKAEATKRVEELTYFPRYTDFPDDPAEFEALIAKNSIKSDVG